MCKIAIFRRAKLWNKKCAKTNRHKDVCLSLQNANGNSESNELAFVKSYANKKCIGLPCFMHRIGKRPKFQMKYTELIFYFELVLHGS
jgi:hypothetical protein